MLPLFVPWALLPWEVAWFAWRGATILLLLWSIRWAYARRPLPTAILVALLAFPIGGEPRHRATSTCSWRSRCSGPSSRAGGRAA